MSVNCRVYVKLDILINCRVCEMDVVGELPVYEMGYHVVRKLLCLSFKCCWWFSCLWDGYHVVGELSCLWVKCCRWIVVPMILMLSVIFLSVRWLPCCRWIVVSMVLMLLVNCHVYEMATILSVNCCVFGFNVVCELP